MGKALYIAEKPSVALEFAKVLHVTGSRRDGYLENEGSVVTWCYGHLVTMSYPDRYDEKYKRWSLDTLPFLPSEFLYEIIPDSKEQFGIVSRLLARDDVTTIYVCTDSGREGEYIYRLVEMMSDPKVREKDRRRVWIDSQTEEEILRGIREAKPLAAYDALGASAYLRAKEDYLMGINFSRLLTLKYGNGIARILKEQRASVTVGRVMTCVLGMVVRREREIREFKPVSFYKVNAEFEAAKTKITGEWHVSETSAYKDSPKLYKENGFRNEEDAKALVDLLSKEEPLGRITGLSRKTEKKNPPLLFNLAELQNECAKRFKISPDETLAAAQELYEKKLTTYPRTDARVLSTAVAKEIERNLKGLQGYEPLSAFAKEILSEGTFRDLAKSRYVDDKAITDHYAIIPTGSGLSNLRNLTPVRQKIYETIVRRFLSVFYPPAEYRKTALSIMIGQEVFLANEKILVKEGYLRVAKEEETQTAGSEGFDSLKKGGSLPLIGFSIKTGETTPPKRYTSGSMILAMENAGQLIEDEDLREQIKGCGIGTSATRAEILKKLVNIRYLALNKKTQVITPMLHGEMVFDAVASSVRSLLDPELTASWEKGLSYVAEGKITSDEYMVKLEDFIRRRVDSVLRLNNGAYLREQYHRSAANYAAEKKGAANAGTGHSNKGSVRRKNNDRSPSA